MKRDLLIAVGLLIASVVAAATSNAVRAISLPWKYEAPPPPPSTTDAPDGTIAMDAVLEHLAGGTARFVDAREEHEFVEGHLVGAIHLPSSAIFKNIDRVLGQVAPIEKVIVYCGGGDCEASHHVADALRRDFGFTDVVIYEKGWAEVLSSGRFNEFLDSGAQP